MKCKICQTEAVPAMQATMLGKYAVQYHGCPNCGFLQTDPPTWLAEAYAQPINRSDVGYLWRNSSLAEVTTMVLSVFMPEGGACVDFGGGYGVYVRLMRDRGYDFYRSDKYCPNLFAPDFEAPDDPSKRYGCLTAFEVFEHLEDPVQELETMLRLSDRILFSTQTIPLPYPALDQWSYYGLEHGQHIALYSQKTLRYLAGRYGLHLYSSPDGSIHFFSRRQVSRFWWNCMFRRGTRRLIKRLVRRPPSLLMPDYQRIVELVRNSQG